MHHKTECTGSSLKEYHLKLSVGTIRFSTPEGFLILLLARFKLAHHSALG